MKADKNLLGGGILFLVLTIIIVGAISLVRTRRVMFESQKLSTEAEAGTRIQTSKVKRSTAQRKLTLTGEALPYSTVTLYAKVSGYLAKVSVDKGDLVKRGQPLAQIESPETDQNYNAAVATALNQSRIANRYRILLSKKLVSQQEAEQAFSNARVSKAQMYQMKSLKEYEQITAPFDGTVTARYADPGALIQNASGAQVGAMPVVTVSQVNFLRVYVYVDQKNASSIRSGIPATISLIENPEIQLPAQVARMAGALDPQTRMLLTEIDLDNQRARIVPGSLVKVSLQIQSPAYLEIPAAALVIRENKQFAGVITNDKTVDFREIKILENDGKFMKVEGELHEGEVVGLDLGNRVRPGAKVRTPASELPGGK